MTEVPGRDRYQPGGSLADKRRRLQEMAAECGFDNDPEVTWGTDKFSRGNRFVLVRWGKTRIVEVEVAVLHSVAGSTEEHFRRDCWREAVEALYRLRAPGKVVELPRRVPDQQTCEGYGPPPDVPPGVDPAEWDAIGQEADLGLAPGVRIVTPEEYIQTRIEQPERSYALAPEEWGGAPENLPANRDVGHVLWIAQTGCQDPECYADGTTTGISVHSGREGAVAAVRSRLPEPRPSVMVMHGPGPVSGTLVEGGRFEWSWAVYPAAVQP